MPDRKPRRRKPGLALLSRESLTSFGLLASLAGVVYGNFTAGMAGRKADAADSRSKSAREATAAVAALASSGAGSDSALAEKLDGALARIGQLEGAVIVLNRKLKTAQRPQMGAKIGPEPAPAWYVQPERRGFFSRLLGNSGR